MPHAKGKLKVLVVFFKPRDRSEDWAKESLWKKAKAIPEVQLVLDEGGDEAARFGAVSSGQTFLYNSNGRLVFSGGITPERGHVGDNKGRDSILAFIETGNAPDSTSLVFGCSLRNPERALAGATK